MENKKKRNLESPAILQATITPARSLLSYTPNPSDPQTPPGCGHTGPAQDKLSSISTLVQPRPLSQVQVPLCTTCRAMQVSLGGLPCGATRRQLGFKTVCLRCNQAKTIMNS